MEGRACTAGPECRTSPALPLPLAPLLCQITHTAVHLSKVMALLLRSLWKLFKQAAGMSHNMGDKGQQMMLD